MPRASLVPAPSQAASSRGPADPHPGHQGGGCTGSIHLDGGRGASSPSASSCAGGSIPAASWSRTRWRANRHSVSYAHRWSWGQPPSGIRWPRTQATLANRTTAIPRTMPRSSRETAVWLRSALPARASCDRPIRSRPMRTAAPSIWSACRSARVMSRNWRSCIPHWTTPALMRSVLRPYRSLDRGRRQSRLAWIVMHLSHWRMSVDGEADPRGRIAHPKLAGASPHPNLAARPHNAQPEVLRLGSNCGSGTSTCRQRTRSSWRTVLSGLYRPRLESSAIDTPSRGKYQTWSS